MKLFASLLKKGTTIYTKGNVALRVPRSSWAGPTARLCAQGATLVAYFLKYASCTAEAAGETPSQLTARGPGRPITVKRGPPVRTIPNLLLNGVRQGRRDREASDAYLGGSGRP